MPSDAMRTPARPASHALSYVLPSQPHTSATSVEHSVDFSAHVPTPSHPSPVQYSSGAHSELTAHPLCCSTSAQAAADSNATTPNSCPMASRIVTDGTSRAPRLPGPRDSSPYLDCARRGDDGRRHNSVGGRGAKHRGSEKGLLSRQKRILARRVGRRRNGTMRALTLRMMTTRASMTGLDRYATVVGVLHSMDRANKAQRRREGAEVCALLLAIGLLAVAMGL